MYVDHPCKLIVFGYLFLFICTILSFSLGYFKLDEVGDRDYLVWTDEKVEAWDQLKVAEEYL